MVDAFGRAAEQAKTCGSDMAIIHAGHGRPSTSSSPRLLTTAPTASASSQNRARLLLIIIYCIRQYCGEDFLIQVRFSGTEYVEGGYTCRRAWSLPS